MSTRKLVLWLLLAVLSLAIGIRAEDKNDKADCSNATLRGNYGFHATGHLFAAVARFTFDGKGGLTGTLYGRTPGNPFGPLEFTGTYSVSSDCIVTDTWLDSTHVSVIVDGGKGYFILNSTPSSADGDTVNSGESRKQ